VLYSVHQKKISQLDKHNKHLDNEMRREYSTTEALTLSTATCINH